MHPSPTPRGVPNRTMLLLVDTQGGPQCSSAEMLTYLADVGVESYLHSGDIAFAGNGPNGDLMVGVEVKKVADLVSSIETGRLADTQMPRMRDDYQQKYILIIGQWGCNEDGELTVLREGRMKRFRRHPKLHYVRVAAFILEAQIAGFHVHTAGSCAEAAHWVKIVAHWWDKPWDKHRALHKFDESGTALMPHPDAMTDFLARVAKALPNVGYERAMAVGAAMGGAEDFSTWTLEQWQRVPGVGSTIARNIWEKWHARR